MSRSFRFLLALRAAGAMGLALLATSAITLFALKSALDGEVDASVLNVASIQAASLTDRPSGEMHFHDWELTPDEAASVRDLVRYAQVWQADGVSLLRSQYMTSNLPLDTAALARAGAGELVWGVQRWDGRPIRTLFYPLERLGALHERHVLQVAAPLDARNQLLTMVAGFLAALTLGLALVTFAGAWWLAGRAVRPVHEVIDQAEAIGAASLDRRIRAYADTREYRRLVDVLNTMLGRLQGAFEAQRRFTADASHELRSPLTAMRGELELALRRERPPEEYRRVLDSTLEEVVRLSNITEELLTLARSDSGALAVRREVVDLPQLVRQVADRLKGPAEKKGLRVELRVKEGLTACVDPTMTVQVVWNLMDNAIKFTPSGGRVSVSLEQTNDTLVLRVDDSGPGFGPGDPNHAFGRFYRADQARTHDLDTSGTGLGLAIVKAVAEAHGGSAGAENRPGGGARVTVRIPLDQGTTR